MAKKKKKKKKETCLPLLEKKERILLWTSTYGPARVGWATRTYISFVWTLDGV